jgi:CheY-like chemotaxis protein
MTNPDSSLPRPRILVVEDEPTVAQMVADVLESDGYDVELAANGRLALDKLGVSTYDLIISDLRMPELDGVGLYRELMSRQPELLSRFFFVSGTTGQPEYRRFLEESAVPVLAKPFTLVALQDLTRRVLAANGPPVVG